MTHDWLEELERLNAERTQGEWVSNPETGLFRISAPLPSPAPLTPPNTKAIIAWVEAVNLLSGGRAAQNAAFIAAAANHMTTLLRGYREMREALECALPFVQAAVFDPLNADADILVQRITAALQSTGGKEQKEET